MMLFIWPLSLARRLGGHTGNEELPTEHSVTADAIVMSFFLVSRDVRSTDGMPSLRSASLKVGRTSPIERLTIEWSSSVEREAGQVQRDISLNDLSLMDKPIQ